MYENSQLQQRRRANNANNGHSSTPHRQRDSYVVHGSQTREDLNQSPYSTSASEMPFQSAASASSPSLMSSPGGHMSSSAASRDRTGEFMAAVRSFQGRQLNGGPNMQHGRAAGAAASSQRQQQLARQSAEFMKIARSIGGDISNTYAKLEKLTLLARRKTLFDDRPREIQELTFIIKEDMNALNRQIGQLQQIAKAQRSAGLQGRHQQSHTSSVVFTLQTKLATMTNNFKEVLEVRTENLKEGKSRQDMFAAQGAVVNSSMPQSAVSGFHSGSVLAMADDDAQIQRTNEVAISMGGMPGEQTQSLLHADQTDRYLAQRADTMQNIEGTIVELGGIFQQLAHMLKEQEEMMVRIDGNVEETAINTELAHEQILKYFRSVTSNRWLMVKCFGVLIFFFILFVVFMA